MIHLPPNHSNMADYPIRSSFSRNPDFQVELPSSLVMRGSLSLMTDLMVQPKAREKASMRRSKKENETERNVQVYFLFLFLPSGAKVTTNSKECRMTWHGIAWWDIYAQIPPLYNSKFHEHS